VAEKTTTIKVVVDAKNADRALEVMRGNFKATADVIKDTGKTAEESLKKVEKSVKDVDSSLSFLTKAFKAAFVIDVVSSFAHQLYDINSKFQGFVATMTVVTGSVSDSKKEFEFITNIANKYGVSITSLTSTYAKLAAAGKDSALTHQDLHKIFDAMAMASNVLHLSMEETRLVFFALQQMVSKGNLSMEELRRQLAEKFPGAVNMMAQAMEVPVKAMEKLIQTGQVASDQVLPKFADVVLRSFGPASVYAVNSLNAEVTRLYNAWVIFILKISESSALLPAIIDILKWLTTALNDNKSGALAIGDEIAKLIKIFGDWLKTLSKDDVSQFFKTMSDILSGLIPILKLTAALLAQLGPPIGAIGKGIGELASLFGNGDWVELMRKAFMYMLAATNMPAAIIFNDLTTSFKANTAAAKDVVAVQAEVTAGVVNYGKSKELQLKDMESDYKQSLRSIQVKTKERDAIKELTNMEDQRRALMAMAKNPELEVADQIEAYRVLLAQEKDYIALKKEASQERVKSSTEYNKLLQPALNYIDALTREANALSLTQEQVDKLNKETMLYGLSQRDNIRLTDLMEKGQARLNAAKADKLAKDMTADRVKTMEAENDSLDKQIKKQQEHNAMIGLGKDALRDYEIAQLELTLAVAESNYVVDEFSKLTMAEYELLGKQIERLKSLIALKKTGNAADDEFEAMMKAQKESMKLWQDMDHYADTFFKTLILKGRDAFDAIRNDLKQFAAELFSLVARKFILNIIGNVVGGSAGQGILNTAANAGANTVAGSVLNAGAGAIAGWAGYAGGAGTISQFIGAASGAIPAGAIGAEAVAAGVGIDTLAAGSGAWLAGLGATGWGLIIVAAIAVVAALSQKPGGAKYGGSAMTSYDSEGMAISNTAVPGSDNGRFFTPRQMDSALQGLVDATSETYQSMIQRLGGKGGAFTFGLGADHDPQGSAASRVSSMLLGPDGKPLYRTADMSMDDKAVPDALKLESARMVLIAIQNSVLPEAIKAIVDTIDAASATADQINAILSLAEAFGTMTAMLEEISTSSIIDAAFKSSTETLAMQGKALTSLASKTVMTVDSINTLTNATVNYRLAVGKLVTDLENVRLHIEDMFANTTRNIQLAGLDDQGKYNFYQNESARLFDQISSASSGEELSRITDKINNDINAAFNLLSPEQQVAMQSEWLERIKKVDELAQQRARELQEEAVKEANRQLDEINRITQELALAMKGPADKQKEAADIQLEAANTALNVNVSVNTPANVTVNNGD
jgi:tape measure domain-containing protein